MDSTPSLQAAQSPAFLVIATGRYHTFVSSLISAARQFFFVGSAPSIYVFSDTPVEAAGVVWVPTPHTAWPGPTLRRAHILLSAREQLKRHDFLVHCDADMQLVGPVGQEIVCDLFAVRHPWFIDQPRTAFTYETRLESTACIRNDEGTVYYAGAFQGGRPKHYLHALETMANAISRDAENGITAIWHDESHWNRFLIDREPNLALGPQYCCPEGWSLPDRRVICLEKDEKAMRKTSEESIPLISLCMIARDNERTIRAALTSAKMWVDEMIVVDTGSTDRTPEIARELGARVEFYPWCDDFSAARNESLRHATGRWLFWMDTDDTLPACCGEQLRQTLLADDISEDVMGFIMQVHCPPDSEPAAYLKAEPQPGAAQGVAIEASSISQPLSVTVVDHVKVFRNRSDLRFEGRIHEQILPAIRKAGGKIEWTDSFVVHSGADHSPEGARRKLDRDLRLLKMDVEERPGHPFVLFNLGMTLLHREAYSEAAKQLQECIRQSSTDESHLRKAYALLADALDRLDVSDEACRCCWEGLGRYPDDPELAFKLGRLLMMRQEWAGAIDAFRRIFSEGRKRFFASVDPGIKGYKAFANLATCHEELGQFHEAAGAWRACLDQAPGFLDAWEGILRASRELDDIGPLFQFAGDLEGRPEIRARALVLRGVALGIAGDASKSAASFDEAMAANSCDVFTLNQYARSLNEQGRWEASIPILDRFCSLDPENPSPHFNLGVSLLQLDRPREAAQALQVALRLRPGHRRTHTLLRECAKLVGVNAGQKNNTDGQVSTEGDSRLIQASSFSFGYSAADDVPILSVCVSIKNRSRVPHMGSDLELFPNCVRSLVEAAREIDGLIELVVADFESADWPLRDWIQGEAGGLVGRVLKVSGDFSRGAGLNLAARHARSEYLLLLDADMLVSSVLVLRGMQLLDEGMAFLPYCRNLGLHGELGETELVGSGNVFVARSAFTAAGGVPEFKSWGGEDDLFNESLESYAPVVREHVEGFFHQWHPEACRHEHYNYAARSDYYSYFQVGDEPKG